MAQRTSAGGRVEDQTVVHYQHIIDDVTARVKPDFVQEGVDEAVLDELRALWEQKLVQTGVLGNPTATRIGATQQQQQQQQFQQQQQQQQAGPRVFGLPAAPPGGHLQQQALPALAASTAPVALQHQQQQSYVPLQLQAGQPGPFMLQQQQQQLVAMQLAAAAQAQAAVVAAAEERKRKLDQAAVGAPPSKQQQVIPQSDGPADDPPLSQPTATEGAAEAEDDDPLSSDDDLGEASEDDIDERGVGNVVLGQFEKVQRSKAKWKVVLKDCLLTLGGRDYLVRRATGEMNF